MMKLIENKVLVLNRNWMAVNIVTVRRALIMIYCEKAKVVRVDDFSTYDFRQWLAISGDRGDNCIHTVNYHIAVPEVMVLQTYKGVPQKEITLSREAIFERDNDRCQYCGKKNPRRQLTIDHVVPRSRGGTDLWTNLVVACLDCNAKKKNRLAQEVGMSLIRKPKKPRWFPHVGLETEIQNHPAWQRFVNAELWESDSDWEEVR